MTTTFTEPQVEGLSSASRAVGAGARTISVSSFDPFAVRPTRPAAPGPRRPAPQFTVPLSAGLRRDEVAPAPGAAVRLTRRGRVLALAVVTVLVFLAFSVGRVSSNAATPPHVAPVRTVVVGPGDTLWGIAKEIAPTRDPRAVVDELSRANHLTGTLRAGQTLVVPAS